MADHENITLRMVLVGKTGNGKSATANTILGEQKFPSMVSAHAVTKTCQKASRTWKGRDLLVVDTPGLFDTQDSLYSTCMEISKCVLHSCPGPHAIILVLQLGRYTEEEQKTVDLIKLVFGEEAMKHTIVLFTRREELENYSLDGFIKDSDRNLKSLIQECGNRCYAISNKAVRAEKESQVQELVEMVEKMVQDNGGTYFSGDIYKVAGESLNQHTEDLRKSYSKQLHEHIKIIEKEFGNKSNQEKEEKIKAERMKYAEKIRNVREEAKEGIFTQIFNWILKKVKELWHTFWS